MKVTRDVILDLFPVYLSGEASHDTKELVESYLKENGELAARLRSQWMEAADNLPLPPELALRSLRRARKLIHVRAWIMAAAIFLSLLPLSVHFGKEGARWVFLQDQPALAVTLFAAGIVLWISWYVIGRRLKLT